jgi:uncharacterized protein (TIGR02118 family)
VIERRADGQVSVLHRRDGTSLQGCLERWAGERHVSLPKALPVSTKWVQNEVVPGGQEPACDGIGELWFDTDATLDAALKSPEMAAAVQDAGEFLDMKRTAMVIVRASTSWLTRCPR